jgi:hypothetical protein
VFIYTLRFIHKTVVHKLKNQPHKQHIWFFSDTKANAEKPKELFFANARRKIEQNTENRK